MAGLRGKVAVSILIALVFFALVIPSSAWSDSASADTSLSGEASWRRIDLIVDVAYDFAVDSKNVVRPTDEIEAEVKTIFAQANEYFRPLQLLLNPVEIQIAQSADDDGYQSATANRSALEMLQTGVKRWRDQLLPEHQLVVVLARGYFSGQTGLAFPSTSCVTPSHSVVFAAQGGSTAMHRYSLAQTLAHEVGHFLGMSHDSNSYDQGASLMWPNFIQYSSGFSELSLSQAKSHAGEGEAGGVCFPYITDNAMLASDSDLDGSSDEQEIRQETDPLDSGSLKQQLESPFYTLWNSFLNTTNIAELVNNGSTSVSANVAMFGLDGNLIYQLQVSVPAYGQIDLIVNDFPGFVRDSYGLLKIEFAGELEGRMSYYRSQAGSDLYEFAYSIPFANGSYGRTAVGFNTFQPSKNPAEVSNEVANWLSIVNLATEAKAFGVYSFDAQGRVLRSTTVTVPGLGRKDIDGGHGFAGSSVVGFHEIVPADSFSPYHALLVRYGSNAPAGVAPTSYSFAYPLIAKAGTGRSTQLFARNSGGEENWLELINTTQVTTTATVQMVSKDGELFQAKDVVLAPHEQVHVNAGAELSEVGLEEGTLVIIPSLANSIVAETMFYYREQVQGSISAVYGVQAGEDFGQELNGSYNLFLGMENWLRIGNPSSSSVKVKVEVNRRAYYFEVGASSFLKLPLHNAEQFKTSADTYGLISVTSLSGQSVVSEMTRERSVDGIVDFITPTILH